ncbi:cupin domain-containing protein [Acidiphilium sp. AL]|uniref:helix-turn-helix domain-containing protein n=1 Tax=Acidiphilium sp. AL TaxID=2871704 RepID=UPI0021CB3A4F|nr:cupin domain-containing protein [Acidiphilium sp. AL]MCU4162032.1 cupin domain-containing protein [Acidiphilium sp. AL]
MQKKVHSGSLTRHRRAGAIIGTQIRDLRRAKGLTLTELAASIGKSVGYISQIERNLSPVTISALQEIADVLQVQIGWFFQGHGRGSPDEINFIVRKDNRRILTLSGSGITEELLSPNLSGQLEVILTRFAPGASTGERDRVRRGEEAGVVMSGALELWVDDKRFRLEEGDSFSFQSVGPHRCRNPGSTPAIVLWVITPPSY